MCEIIYLPSWDLSLTICEKNDVITILSDDFMKYFEFLHLETDRFYSPIELLAEVADSMNVFDSSNIKIKDIKKPEDISGIFGDAEAFLNLLDLVVVNKCPDGIFANMYKRLSFMLFEHVKNMGVLSYFQPKWWRNWDIDHKEYYQSYMDCFLTKSNLH